jgi:hypothetical protein
VLLKLHHALTDGAGAFAVAVGLLDALPVPHRAAAHTPKPPARSALDTVKDTVSSTLAQAGEAATIAAEEGTAAAVNGETAATAFGREMHATWDYGPGFSREFTLKAGGRVDGSTSRRARSSS